MNLAHSGQFTLLMSHLTANSCAAADASGNTLCHHMFLSVTPNVVGDIIGRVMESDSTFAMRLKSAGETPWLLAPRKGNIAWRSVMSIFPSVAFLDGGETTALHETSTFVHTKAVRFLIKVVRRDVSSLSADELTAIRKAGMGSHIESVKKFSIGMHRPLATIKHFPLH
jgi:hypothetical protein